MQKRLLIWSGGKRRQCLLLILSAIYAICLVWGKDIMLKDTVAYGSFDVILRICINVVLIDIILNIILAVLISIDTKISPVWKSRQIKMSDKKLFFCVFLCIIICWLPTYIACFPGLGIYDGPTQVVNPLTTHHTIMHSLLLKMCNVLAIRLGWSSWLFPYAIIQSLFLASVYSYLIIVLKRWGVPGIVIGPVIAWFCIFPVHALMALASTKDSIFTGFFVLFICKLSDLFYAVCF